MEPHDDLSDIPGVEIELQTAEARKSRTHFDNVLKAAMSIAYQFERLKEQFDVQEKLSLGIAIAYGDVEVRVQGDATHKKELDIDGEVILRWSRLDSYTKVIQCELAINGTVIVLSPELLGFADLRMFKAWNTSEERLQIKSYPEIQNVAFHVFLDTDERRDSIIKMRAS